MIKSKIMLAVLASSYDFSISALREKCSDTEFFLGRIFPYSVRMWENTDQKKLCIWKLFTQCFYFLLGLF